MFMRRRSPPVSYHPFAKYGIGVLVEFNKNHFVFRKYPDLLIEISGYGTKNLTFKYGIYRRYDNNKKVWWFLMTTDEIQKFKQEIFKSHSQSLSEMADNLKKFSFNDFLPVEIKEELKGMANNPVVKFF